VKTLSAAPVLGRMERQMALQQELMAAISHEIRTPVARLSFAVQLMQDRLQEQVPNLSHRHQLTQSCQDMALDLEEINDLVAEIMTYIHLEDGGPSIRFQPTSISLLCQSVLAQYLDYDDRLDMQLMLPDKDINNIGLNIEAEPVQLRRALQNLVGNAVKYARSKINIGYELLHDGSCSIYVEDDGPGIDSDDYGRIFAPFIRLDSSRSRATGGFGLGLSIVRRIAYWHGGRAEAGVSQRLGGARMSLRLPIHQKASSKTVLDNGPSH